MLPTLPALRSLGDLADAMPVVVVDSREQKPLVFNRLPSQRAALQTGDYSVGGLEDLFAVERKSAQDLVGCCVGENRERFFRELHRLRGFRFKRLLIVAGAWDIENRNYVGQITPKAVFATLAAIEARFDVPVVFCPDPDEAARRIETWIWYFAREVVKGANGLARTAGVVGQGAPTLPGCRGGHESLEA